MPTPFDVRAAHERPALPPGPYAVAGLARAGRAAAEALAARFGPSAVRVWERDERPDTRASAEALDTQGVRVSLGGDGADLLAGKPQVRCLVKSPGIPFDAPLMAEATARGLTVIDEAELGWRLNPRPFIGVTGTNGKGTSAALIQAALAANGMQAVLAGNTLFGPPLSQAADQEADVIVAELSSYQLAGSPCLLPDASLFTNLGQQHWDYHGSRAAYASAKRRMFVRGGRAVGAAAINADDEHGTGLAREAAARGARVVSYGRSSGADYRLTGGAWSFERATVELSTPAGAICLKTPLIGGHNAVNVAGAMALLGALGLDNADSRAALAEMCPVPGRFELVAGPRPMAVIVDFAHNPQGVEAALGAARPLVDETAGGRLVALGGPLWVHDPPMRRVAVRVLRALADEAVVTTQRWRKEEPLAPPPDVVEEARRPEGCPCLVIPERGKAIAHVIDSARAGDVVMLLGRGAFDGRIYDGEDRPRRFVDREVAMEALEARRASPDRAMQVS